MTLNPSETNTYWTRNADVLKQHQPHAFQILQQTNIPHEQLVVIQAKDESPNLAIRLANGQTAALHDMQSPRNEAKQWVGSLEKAIEQQNQFILLGMGMGYPLFELIERCDESSVFWVVEPEPALMKYAFHFMDFSKEIQSGRVHFLPGAKVEDVIQYLFEGEFSARIKAKGVRLLLPAFARQIYGEYSQKLAKQISDRLQMEGLKFQTSEKQGRRILENIVKNLPHLFQGAPWKRLIGTFQNMPAIVVAAGPSLEEHIFDLLSLQEKALIIAVDTAHPILLKNGIHADIVVSIDFTKLNAKHFEDIEQDRTYLLAYPGIDPSICKKYSKQTYFFDHAGNVHCNTSASPLLSSIKNLEPLGHLISYGSTSHAAYHAAQQMGCDPIIFVGQDLAFPRDQWYAQGAMQTQLEQPEREEEEYLEVESNDGGMVKTSGLYKTYLDGFAELIEATKGNVINTSPHGAIIHGAKWMEFEKAIENLPDSNIDKSILKQHLTPTLEDKKEACYQELKQWKMDCQRIRKKLKTLRDTLNPSDQQFQASMVGIMKEFVWLAQRERTVLNLCSALCSRTTTTMLGELGNVNVFGGKSVEQNRAAWERADKLLQDFAHALKVHVQTLPG